MIQAAAVVKGLSLAQEITHAVGVAKKKKKKELFLCLLMSGGFCRYKAPVAFKNRCCQLKKMQN